ncbi:Aste57867_2625 [Aphanomyces stellatus]|uniref:Aste57867_2625 protein n=1 Tax=Aphanomyces stellatus TaxID=120398 RepID=A0A485K8P7_9STRA|nr:hypothetical protein As57867_002618 [Aphanomyces stellatus]VFT79821.1 Aste57867_2625 [Aphanomyces stellatus]
MADDDHGCASESFEESSPVKPIAPKESQFGYSSEEFDESLSDAVPPMDIPGPHALIETPGEKPTVKIHESDDQYSTDAFDTHDDDLTKPMTDQVERQSTLLVEESGDLYKDDTFEASPVTRQPSPCEMVDARDNDALHVERHHHQDDAGDSSVFPNERSDEQLWEDELPDRLMPERERLVAHGDILPPISPAEETLPPQETATSSSTHEPFDTLVRLPFVGDGIVSQGNIDEAMRAHLTPCPRLAQRLEVSDATLYQLVISLLAGQHNEPPPLPPPHKVSTATQTTPLAAGIPRPAIPDVDPAITAAFNDDYVAFIQHLAQA